LEILVQHVRDHAKDVRQIAPDEMRIAAFDFEFEVEDDDYGEVSIHDSDCLAPTRRRRAG
jgi:hypothetical protein